MDYELIFTSSGQIKKDRRVYKHNISSLRCEVHLYSLLPLKDQGTVVLGTHRENEIPSQKCDYEQSEKVSKRRERKDGNGKANKLLYIKQIAHSLYCDLCQ